MSLEYSIVSYRCEPLGDDEVVCAVIMRDLGSDTWQFVAAANYDELEYAIAQLDPRVGTAFIIEYLEGMAEEIEGFTGSNMPLEFYTKFFVNNIICSTPKMFEGNIEALCEEIFETEEL